MKKNFLAAAMIAATLYFIIAHAITLIALYKLLPIYKFIYVAILTTIGIATFLWWYFIRNLVFLFKEKFYYFPIEKNVDYLTALEMATGNQNLTYELICLANEAYPITNEGVTPFIIGLYLQRNGWELYPLPSDGRTLSKRNNYIPKKGTVVVLFSDKNKEIAVLKDGVLFDFEWKLEDLNGSAIWGYYYKKVE